uniref:AAA domain-containing protein n=1 Tax=Thermosporothrix sp. COM3 TaxID=2490863 RepID=A0A455SLC9_9CHLR|nr:hypothetical protein KTC_24730 [Thermosporothrix sp. COM3]
MGKTVFTATLLAMLSMLGYEVVGVDCDPQGHLGMVWGYLRDSLDEGIYDILLKYSSKELREKRPIEKIVLPTYYDAEGEAQIFDPRTPSLEQRVQAIREIAQGQVSIEQWEALETLTNTIEDQEQLDKAIRETSAEKYTLSSFQELQTQIEKRAQELLQERIEKARRGPDIIPITAEASDADYTLKGKHEYWGEQLRHALAPLLPAYDYVFIDCPPSIGVLTKNALNAADYVCIPLTPETLPMEGMLGLLGVIEQAQERANENLQIAGIQLNKVHSNWNVHQEMSQDIRQWEQGVRVFNTEIKQSAQVASALSMRSLIVLNKPDSTIARSYWRLLHEMLEIIGGPAREDVAEIVRKIDEDEQLKKERREKKVGKE